MRHSSVLQGFSKTVQKCHNGSFQVAQNAEWLNVLEPFSSLRWYTKCTLVHWLFSWRTRVNVFVENRDLLIPWGRNMTEPFVPVFVRDIDFRAVRWNTGRSDSRNHAKPVEFFAATSFPNYIILFLKSLSEQEAAFFVRDWTKKWLRNCLITGALLQYLMKNLVHDRILEEFRFQLVKLQYPFQ